MSRILIIDDDQDLCDLLIEYLTMEGFEVMAVYDGAEGARTAVSRPFDLIVLDIMLPSMDGLECLRQIRGESQVPVLMLTAKGDDVDRIVGLELGADDYLPKPCNPRELVARLRAILRRTQAAPKPASKHATIVAGPICINPKTRAATLHGNEMELTSTEFNILILLVEDTGSVVSKETISERALNRKLTRYDRSIDMHISHLRRKLGDSAEIKTVRSMGYQLAVV